MPNLITVRGPDGKILARCNQKCYDGTAGTCHCICGGRLHGLGLQHAAALLRKPFELAWQNLDKPADPKRCSIQLYHDLSKAAHPQFHFTE